MVGITRPSVPQDSEINDKTPLQHKVDHLLRDGGISRDGMSRPAGAVPTRRCKPGIQHNLPHCCLLEIGQYFVGFKMAKYSSSYDSTMWPQIQLLSLEDA